MRLVLPQHLFLLFLPASLLAQSLDWSGDLIVFGTSEDECCAAVAIHPAGAVIHAFCVRDDASLDCKVSSNLGQTWSDASYLAAPAPGVRVASSVDRSYAYACMFGTQSSLLRLYRFPGTSQDWSTALAADLSDSIRGHLLDVVLLSDQAFQPDDPFLNVVWSERDSGGNQTRIMFTQSRDRGMLFREPRQLISFARIDGGGEVGLSVAWDVDQEIQIAVSSVDRPGVIPEGIMAFRSFDQGLTWTAGLELDSVAYPQVTPAVASYGTMVLIAYARRSGAAEQRDIYFTYSPDGGEHFAPAMTVADSSADEHDPCIVFSEDGNSFLIAYLAGGVVDEAGTILGYTGRTSTPWAIGEPFAVSGPGSAFRSGGFNVSAGEHGYAAVWTSRFDLGDLDVVFDASWRGLATAPRARCAVDVFQLGAAYPNPFNGQVTLPMQLQQSMILRLRIHNGLGQTVMLHNAGLLSPGRHLMTLDLSSFPSGVYYVEPVSFRSLQRLTLVR